MFQEEPEKCDFGLDATQLSTYLAFLHLGQQQTSSNQFTKHFGQAANDWLQSPF
jgi:hypothetical protein